MTFLLFMDLGVIAYYEHHDALCVGDVWMNDASTFRSGPRAGSHIGRFLAFGAVFAGLASCLALGGDVGAPINSQFLTRPTLTTIEV